MQDCSLALGVVVGEVVREMQVVLVARVCSYKFKKKIRFSLHKILLFDKVPLFGCNIDATK